MFLKPVSEERVKYDRLVFLVESDYLLFLEGIFYSPYIGRGVEPVFLDHIGGTESRLTVQNGFQQTHLVVGAVVGAGTEPRPVSGTYYSYCLHQDPFIHEPFRQGVAYGYEMVEIPHV